MKRNYFFKTVETPKNPRYDIYEDGYKFSETYRKDMAALISAAPYMLEALETLMASGELSEDSFKLAENSVKKAKGDSDDSRSRLF